MFRRKAWRAGLSLMLAGVLIGCQPSPAPPVTLGGATMGTSYAVKLDELPAGVDAAELQRQLDARLETINNQMSTYRPESELSRFNRAAAGAWFAVSPATAEVVAAALATSRLSGGAFDPTVGPLVNLWHFGPPPHSKTIPSDAQIAAARAEVGYEHLEVRRDPPALKKSLDGIYVDLSAIAKGYAVDVLAEYLASLGARNYLVEIGGEVRAAGRRPDGGAWKVAIERPTEFERGIHKIVPLRDVSLATSGGYRNFFEVDGQRFSHTIDPRTGRPVTHALASVSVVAATCAEADALATTLMVLGPEAGYNLALERQLAAYFLVPQASGWRELATPAFTALLEASREE